MALITVKVPALKGDEQEAVLAEWFVENKKLVKEGDAICEMETDKASFDIIAEVTGVIECKHPEGTVLQEGDILATIEVFFS